MRVLAALLGAAFVAAALAAFAGAAAKRHESLSGCVYITNQGLSSVLHLVISDAGAPRAKGVVTFTGAGLNEKANVVLDARGTGRVSFTATTFNKYAFAVTLSKPKAGYRVNFTMSPANDVTTSSCTPA